MPSAPLLGLLDYLARAQLRIQIHSTWVGELYDCLRRPPKAPAQALADLEHLRQSLARDPTQLQLMDLGAGGDSLPGRQRTTTVRRLARTGTRRPYTGRQLTTLVEFQQPQAVLELGTQLGLATAYLALGLQPRARLTSLEGDPQLAELAQKHLRQLGLHRQTKVLHTSFEDFLASPQARHQAPQGWELVFLDGRHTYSATLAYVEALQPLLAEEALLVLDDIYWSTGMRRAWRELQQDSRFPVSVDLYRLGLLVRRNQAPQHFALALPFWRR